MAASLPPCHSVPLDVSARAPAQARAQALALAGCGFVENFNFYFKQFFHLNSPYAYLIVLSGAAAHPWHASAAAAARLRFCFFNFDFKQFHFSSYPFSGHTLI